MMKKIALASFLLAIITLCSVALTTQTSALPKGPEPSAKVEARKLESDAERTISVLVGDKIVKMNVHDYLVGVVAAEMPVSFEPEALKAQAVAARSFLERSLGAKKHKNADICASPDCCQAYASKEILKSKWKDNYDTYIKRIDDAVKGSDARYLSYEGKAALAAFHSSSNGKTEASGAIWNELPYLVSVSSAEKKEDVPKYVTTESLADIDFRDTILYLKPEADMTGEADSWVGKTLRNSSGRVESMEIGKVKFTGAELRSLFSLRSTSFTLTHKNGQFIFTVTGYGHGVGMSQYGANELAKEGYSFEEILAHYYPNTVLS